MSTTHHDFIVKHGLSLADNTKIKIGNSDDLQIYHDGTNNLIQGSAGNVLYIQAKAGENSILAVPDAAVTLYHNNSLKFETTSTGVSVTGSVTSTTGFTTAANTRVQASSGMLFLNGPSALTFEVGAGSEKMRLTSTGLGIGITSPSAPLDVVTNSTVYAAEFTQSNTSNGDGVFISVGSTAAADYALTVRSDAGNTSVLAAKADGKVGIGTFTPTRTLDVIGDFGVKKGSSAIAFNEYNNGATIWLDGSNGDFTGGDYFNISAFGTTDLSFGYAGGVHMTLKNTGNVGIGTTTPSETLHLKSANPVIRLEDSNPNGIYAQIDGAGGSLILSADQGNGSANSSIVFKNDNTERMRIDSSGNLLVGKTTSTGTSIGAELRPTGIVTATVSGNSAIFLNRKSSDGSIATFQKDNTTVGGIGVDSSIYLKIDTSYSGLFFDNTRILPTANGSLSDGGQDLGRSATRFKDLYLSGGVIGGGAIQSYAGTQGAAAFRPNNDLNTGIFFPAADTFAVTTGGSEAYRVDSFGNLLVGTTSSYGDKLNVNGTGHFTGNLTLSRQTNDSGSTGLILEKTRNTSVNGNTVVQSGDQLGYVAFRGNDGDQFLDGAYILSFVDSTPGNNDMPTNLQFWTTADGASSPIERMRINSSGNVGIGTTSLDSITSTVATLSLGGTNAGTSGGIAYQTNGTTEAYQYTSGDFLIHQALSGIGQRFHTNNTERMRINSSGNVGIGTTAPLYKLHVSGTGHQRLLVEKTDAGGDADLQFRSQDDSTQWILFNDTDTGNNSGVIKYVHSTNKMHFRTNDVDDRLVISSNGNVGIGTASPSAKLHVYEGSTTGVNIGIQNTERYWNIETNDGLLKIQDVTAGILARMTFDTQGRVGIGTTAPAAGIHLTKSSSSTYLRMDDGSNCLINFSADTNTAIMQVQETGFSSWKPLELRANYLVFKPNNTETMRLTSTGLGIGTSSPSYKLDVNGSGTVIYAGGTASNNEIVVERITTSPSKLQLQAYASNPSIRFTANGNGRLRFLDSSDNERVSFLESGNVGIGESIPTEKLHVAGNIKMQATTAIVTYQNAANTWNIGLDAADASFKFKDGTAERIRIDSSGNVGIGTTQAGNMHTNASKLVVGTGSGDQGMSVFAGTSVGRYAFARSAANNSDAFDGGMSYDGNRNLKFHTNANATRMTIDGSGNVGIGTTSPGQKLTVAGGHIKLDSGMSLQWSDSYERIEQSDGHLEFFVNNGEAMTLDTNGLGIGTTAPQGRLHVAQSKASGGDLWTQIGAGNAPSIHIQNTGNAANTNAVLYFRNSSAEKASIGARFVNQSTGETELRFGTTNSSGSSLERMVLTGVGALKVGLGTVSLPGLSFKDDPNTGLYRPSSDNLGFAIGGTARAFMSNTQFNVAAKIVATELDINGNADVSGTLTVGTFAPTSIAITSGTVKLDGNYPVGTGNVALGDTALDSVSSSGNYNVAIGMYSLTTLSDGDYNTAVGYNSGANISTGTQNALVGSNAGDAITTGGYNTALGHAALGSVTTGTYNTGIGRNSVAAVTTGVQNTGVGSAAADAITTGNYNTALGYQALTNDTLGSKSTALGRGTLVSQNFTSATDAYNVAVGFNAGNSTTTGTNNTLIGAISGDAITTASNNTAVGYNASGAITTGGDNASFGYRAMESLTSGNSNVALGPGALRTMTVGDRNTALGYEALRTANVGSNADTYNVAVGYAAGALVTTAIQNTLIGSLAGDAITTGSDNTAVGKSSLSSATTGSHNTALGHSAGINVTTGTFNVAIGREALRGATTSAASVAIGYSALRNNNTSNNVAVGYDSLYNNTSGGTNTAVGYASARTNTTGAGLTIMGYAAFYNNTSGGNNVGIGFQAGYTNTSGYDLTYVGHNAGFNNTTGPANTGIGRLALHNNTTGEHNTALGRSSLFTNSSGHRNTAIGLGALYSNTTASNNVAMGRDSLYYNTTGTNNTSIGYNASKNQTTASNNTTLGYQAQWQVTTGGKNIAIGTEASKSLISGVQNVAVGAYANWQNTNNNNVAIGYSSHYGSGAATQNVAVGAVAMFSVQDGGGNTAVGYNSQNALTNGVYNTAVGRGSLASNITGSYNVAIGAQSMYNSTGATGNTAVGYNSLNVNSSGAGHVAIGEYSLDANTTGTENTAVGSYSMTHNSTGAGNVAMGRESLASNTTAGNNVAIGKLAMYTNTTGGSNTAVGTQALRLNTSGAGNVAIGIEAMRSNTTAGYNVAVGHEALYANVTALGNTAVGAQALRQNTNGVGNSAFGTYHPGSRHAALRFNTTGGYNCAFGPGSLSANTTASNNTAMGYGSMATNTTGAQNVAVGSNALDANTTANDNTAVGYHSLGGNTTGAMNTAVGGESLLDNTTGSYNVAVGRSALANNTTGNSSVAVGQSSLGTATSAIYNVAIGQQSLTTTSTGGQNVGVGYSTLRYYTAHDAVAIGAYAGEYATTGCNISIGSQAGRNYTTGGNNIAIGILSQTTGQTNTYNTSIGSYALRYVVTGNNNTALGAYAGHATTSGHSNVFIARDAGLYNATGLYNIAVGVSALRTNVAANRNTAIGHDALYHMTASSSNDTNNTAVGFYAGRNVSTGVSDTFIGSNAGRVVTTGGYSTFVGTSSGYSATTGNYNTSVGRESMFNLTTGSSNTALGRNAGQGNSTGDGNVAIGASALLTTNTAGYRTAIGTNAGYLSTGASNVFIGASSGYHMTTGAQNTFLGPFSGNSNNLDLRTAVNNIVLADGGGVPKMWLAGEAVRFGGSYQNNTIVLSSVTTTSTSGGVGGANRMELEFMEPSYPNYGAKKLRLGVQGGGYVKMEFPGSGGLYAFSPYGNADRIHLGYGGVNIDMLYGGYGQNQHMLIRCVNSIKFSSGGTGEALVLDSSKHATFAGNINLADNKELRLGGTSTDFALVHDAGGTTRLGTGNTNYIDSPHALLFELGSSSPSVDFCETSGPTGYFGYGNFVTGPSANAFYATYNGTNKIATTSIGLQVYGKVETTGVTIENSTGADTEMYATGTGTSTLNIRKPSTSPHFQLTSTGGLTIGGSLTQNSDRNIKDNIEVISDSLNKVSLLNGSTYTRIDEGQDPTKVHAGLVAQDVELALPEAVGETEDGIKTVDYSAVVALLVESVKTLTTEVSNLKKEINELKK